VSDAGGLVPPPSPVNPNSFAGSKGELRVTPTGVVTFDGQQWTQLDLFALITDDPAVFDHIVANDALLTDARFPTGDPKEVVPGEIFTLTAGQAFVGGVLVDVIPAALSDPTRRAVLRLTPPTLNEKDLSVLTTGLTLSSSSVDGTIVPNLSLAVAFPGTGVIGSVAQAGSIGLLGGTYVLFDSGSYLGDLPYLYLAASSPGAGGPTGEASITLQAGGGLGGRGGVAIEGDIQGGGAVDLWGGAVLTGGVYNDKLTLGSGASRGTNYVQVTRTALVQPMTPGAWIDIAYNTITVNVNDNGGGLYASPNFTSQPAGLYTATATCSFSALGQKYLRWVTQGGSVISQTDSAAGGTMSCPLTAILPGAGYWVKLQCNSAAAANLTISTTTAPSLACFGSVA
jgi:hypothetical protein